MPMIKSFGAGIGVVPEPLLRSKADRMLSTAPLGSVVALPMPRTGRLKHVIDTIANVSFKWPERRRLMKSLVLPALCWASGIASLESFLFLLRMQDWPSHIKLANPPRPPAQASWGLAQVPSTESSSLLSKWLEPPVCGVIFPPPPGFAWFYLTCRPLSSGPPHFLLFFFCVFPLPNI